jgi:hypothetical protein
MAATFSDGGLLQTVAVPFCAHHDRSNLPELDSHCGIVSGKASAGNADPNFQAGIPLGGKRPIFQWRRTKVPLIVFGNQNYNSNFFSDLDSLPPIVFVTPTAYRATQKADLTRLAQTLANMRSLFWIVIEVTKRHAI